MDEADVRDARGEVAGEQDENEDDAAEGELEEDGFEGCVAGLWSQYADGEALEEHGEDELTQR